MPNVCITLNVTLEVNPTDLDDAISFGQNGEGDDLNDYIERYFRAYNHPAQTERFVTFPDTIETTVIDAFEVDA